MFGIELSIEKKSADLAKEMIEALALSFPEYPIPFSIFNLLNERPHFHPLQRPIRSLLHNTVIFPNTNSKPLYNLIDESVVQAQAEIENAIARLGTKICL